MFHMDAGPYHMNQSVNMNCTIDRVYPLIKPHNYFNITFKKNKDVFHSTRETPVGKASIVGIENSFIASSQYQDDTATCQASTKRGHYSKSIRIKISKWCL